MLKDMQNFPDIADAVFYEQECFKFSYEDTPKIFIDLYVKINLTSTQNIPHYMSAFLELIE